MTVSLQDVQARFRSAPLLAATELRLAHRQIDPGLVMQARSWLAAQHEAQRAAQLEARAANERTAQFNAQLASLGGSPTLQYQSAGLSGSPTAMSDALFWNAVEQVGSHQGHPAGPAAFRQRARDVATGKLDVWTSLELLSSEDPQAMAGLQMLRGVLGPAPLLSHFEWYRDMTSWWEQTFLGKLAVQFDPMKHAWHGFGMMARVAAVLAAPPGGYLLWLYADLHADAQQGRAAAHAAALREAILLRDHDRDRSAAREMGHVALYLGAWVGASAELAAIELLLGLDVEPRDRDTFAGAMARIHPQALGFGGALAARFEQAARALAAAGVPA